VSDDSGAKAAQWPPGAELIKSAIVCARLQSSAGRFCGRSNGNRQNAMSNARGMVLEPPALRHYLTWARAANPSLACPNDHPSVGGAEAPASQPANADTYGQLSSDSRGRPLVARPGAQSHGQMGGEAGGRAVRAERADDTPRRPTARPTGGPKGGEVN